MKTQEYCVSIHKAHSGAMQSVKLSEYCRFPALFKTQIILDLFTGCMRTSVAFIGAFSAPPLGSYKEISSILADQ
jgi:hypothetical protein